MSWREVCFVPAAGAVSRFRSQPQTQTQCTKSKVLMSLPASAAQSTRRAFLSLVTSSLLISAVPQASHAITRQEAEQEARLAYASLSTLSGIIDDKKYDEFRRQLRTGAMSRVRISCSAWYRSFEPTDARATAGEKSYKGLIKAVEAADYAALKAERGESGENVGELVLQVGARFDEFLGVVGA